MQYEGFRRGVLRAAHELQQLWVGVAPQQLPLANLQPALLVNRVVDGEDGGHLFCLGAPLFFLQGVVILLF